MIDVGGKARFLAGEFFQMALSGLALRSLKFRTEFTVPIANPFDRGTGKRLPSESVAILTTPKSTPNHSSTTSCGGSVMSQVLNNYFLGCKLGPIRPVV